ncbi:MAG: hypothetical protein OXG82_01290 [Gammaproteobacteria bacterium]|nr:hypothetical protein [Gammaproteobacteria bacterium]
MNTFQLGAVAKTVEVSLSAALTTSSDARDCCARLEGKTIAFESLDERLVVCFESSSVHVETETDEADATVRGSPTAVLGALFGKGGDTVAVLGDATVFEDFRDSFRPHLKLPPAAERFMEDASDAVRVGAKAVKSAIEGVATATRDHWPDWLHRAHPDTGELRGEVDELKARMAALEERLAAVESADEAPPDEAASS